MKKVYLFIILSLYIVSCNDDNDKQSMAQIHKNHTNALIDLSEFNGPIDFKLAKEDGILGVFHRATIGAPELRVQGKQSYKVEDAKYKERAILAEAEGLLWGAYHYGLGGSGVDQAKHFLEVTNALNKPNIRLALDFEEPKDRGDQMTLSEARDFVVEIHRQAGVWPIIYGGRILRESAALEEASTLKILSNCPLWIPRYGEESTIVLPRGWNQWTIWQYTDGNKGIEPRKVKGIDTGLRDKFNGSLEELRMFWISGIAQ